jgi:hypothetical protein
VAEGLVVVGRECVTDNVDRIAQRVAYDDQPQKENSPAYAEWKRRHRGHDIPLRKDDVLNDPSRGYTINGVQAFGTVPPPTEELLVKVALTNAGTPPRDEVVGWLRILGYRYWGVSAYMMVFFRARMVWAVNAAEAEWATV